MDTGEEAWGEAITWGGGRQKGSGDDQGPPGYTPGNPPASSLELALEVFRILTSSDVQGARAQCPGVPAARTLLTSPSCPSGSRVSGLKPK